MRTDVDLIRVVLIAMKTYPLDLKMFQLQQNIYGYPVYDSINIQTKYKWRVL